MPLSVTSQPSGISKKAYIEYQDAVQLARRMDYKTAIEKIEKLLKKEPTYAEAHAGLGNIYKELQKSGKAIEHYEKAIALKPEEPQFALIYFQLGDYYFKQKNYADSKARYAKYLQLETSSKKISRAVAELMFSNCDFAAEQEKNPIPFYPKKLSTRINCIGLQYYPALTADEKTILFTGRVPYKLPNGVTDWKDENLYYSIDENGLWTKAVPLPGAVNTSESEGTACISADGKTLVFTACGRKDTYGSCDLYISRLEGKIWSTPKNLGQKVNSTAWDSHPSLSSDGNTLYFASIRKGGFGSHDIWKSEKDSTGEWKTSVNLGNTINTLLDDLGPYIHANNKTLYFASNGHTGMGGYDLFFSNQNETGEWETPKNFGYPVNTSENENAFAITANGKTGYFSVEKRNGVRTDSIDIYQFTLPENMRPKIPSTYTKGNVFDAKTKLPLEADLELYELKTGKQSVKLNSDKVDGSYLVVLNEGESYGLFCSKDGYLFKSFNFDYSDKKSFDAKMLDIYLEKLEVDAKVVLNNVFFPTAEYKLEDASKTELEKLVKFLNYNKSVTIEISGHTDNVGKKENNLLLSKNRAKSVYDFLVTQNIDATRLVFEGYGDAKPVMSNETKEGRQMNRRTEFRVVKK